MRVIHYDLDVIFCEYRFFHIVNRHRGFIIRFRYDLRHISGFQGLNGKV